MHPSPTAPPELAGPAPQRTVPCDEPPPGDGVAAPTSTLGRDSLTVAVGTMLSRLTGLVRVAVIAAVLGPTFFGNLFQTLNLLPNLLFELVVGALVASLLVPPLVSHLDRGDRAATVRVARGFLGMALVVFAAVGSLVVLASPVVLRVLSVGIADDTARALYLHRGALLLVLLVPQVLCYAIAATGNAVLQAHGRFAMTSAAPLLENLGVIATVVAFGFLHGFGIALEDVTTGQLLFIGIGTTASTGLHAGAQWIGAWRVGVTLLPSRGWRDPEVRAIGRLGLSSLSWATLGSARIGAALVVVGAVPGGVVAFQLALNAVQAVVAVGARPTAMALLAPLTRATESGDERAFADHYARGVTLASFFVLPATAALVIFGSPIAAAIALGEMASELGVLLLTVAIVSLAPAAIGDGLFAIATNAAYARRDSARPLEAMTLRLALVVLGLAVAWTLTDGAWLLFATGVALTAADLVSAVVLDRNVRRSVGSQRLSAADRRQRLASMTSGLAAAAIGFTILSATDRILGPVAAGRVSLGIGGAVAVAGYLALKWSVYSPELASLRPSTS